MTQVINIMNQLRMNGEDLSYMKVVNNTLITFVNKFDVVVVATKESKDLPQL